MDPVPSRAACPRPHAWRRALAVLLVALLSPFPALMAFWSEASGNGYFNVWVDPDSGHVFTLAELDAFSDDIDGDGLLNWQELQLGTNPFVPDTDGDGISDSLGSFQVYATNLSPINGIAWGAVAMEDADADGIGNFFDPSPYGQGRLSAGRLDTDGDGFPDDLDPAPWDICNLSPFNGINWMWDALGDADGDGVPNFYDWYPYDSSHWDPSPDPDGDGFIGAMDPVPGSDLNPSPVNYLGWGGEVYGDYDGDGVPNFYDPYPYVSCKGGVPMDADGDGITDSLDPSPWDYYNYSAANGISWLGDANGDADGDGIANFYDQFPYDYYNGYNPAAHLDSDGDGIPDVEDPAPYDPTNFSPINGGRWYSAALADADGDGNPNFTDPWPYDPTNGAPPSNWDSWSADSDGDGIPNAIDPALADPANFSIHNGTSWYGDALGDGDGDGIVNFRDEYPYDYYNGRYFGPDSDGDGIPDQQDPYPYDPYNNADSDNDGILDAIDPVPNDQTNLSPINGIAWYGDARGDADGDGVLNFWDLEPYGPPQADSDGDGLIDSIDPAPYDPNNFSPYNMISWPSDALGDADGDGTPNFFDHWPYDGMNGMVDSDGDGLWDDADPAPSDPLNYSPFNNIDWMVDALGDLDNDGIFNFYDAWPYDPYNSLARGGDADADGILNEQDPDPRNDANVSPFNGLTWGQDLLGDADGDGVANYWDSSPFGENDVDGDGIPDVSDPVPDDRRNYSPINLRRWYGYALRDNDLDQILNFYDPDPEGGKPYEPSYDELPWAMASPLVLLNDDYDELGEMPALGVKPLRDLDDESLVIKAGPRFGIMATKGLTKLDLLFPYDYTEAGGSVTIAKEGDGLVRIHAVRMEGGVGVEEHLVPLGPPYVPSTVGAWEYWIEGVAEGAVTLSFYFPAKKYGRVDSWHPQGAMPESMYLRRKFMVCAAHLSVDRDRDGKINPGAYSDTTFPDRPFRFWVNDDSDSGEAGDAGVADVPGTASEAGLYNGHVDGSRDLVDFFPVYLDIKSLINLVPPGEGVSYKLKHADGALSFVQTDLLLSHSNCYLKEVLPNGFGDEFKQGAASATTCRITPEGVELKADLLSKIQNGKDGVILVEGHFSTASPLVLSVEQGRRVVVELKLDISLCGVERMFRHVDLTGLAREYDGPAVTSPKSPRPTEMDDPIGLPDSETIDKYFVFVHGYNVDAQKARGWNAEVFKRLYALGSRARFIGVTWNGDTGLDYHKAVFQAFQAGDGLAGALGLKSPDVTVAAHSLGNMVVSHAIQAGGFHPKNYFMINAAVPLEAYDPSVLEQKGPGSAYEVMTEDSWKGKDPRSFASNWHGLFDSEEDSRAKLTWKGLFNEVKSKSRVTNFYSPGEDVVENPRSSSSRIIEDMIRNWDTSKGAWGHQEMIKGGGALGGLAFSRVQGGWRLWDISDVLASTSEFELRKSPRFFPFLEGDLFSEDVVTGSNRAAELRVAYDVLARGIPAMSYGAAANEINTMAQDDGNFNMEMDGRNFGLWPTEGHGEEFRAGRWIHSDFKNVALPYVCKMYQSMITKGDLHLP